MAELKELCEDIVIDAEPHSLKYTLLPSGKWILRLTGLYRKKTMVAVVEHLDMMYSDIHNILHEKRAAIFTHDAHTCRVFRSLVGGRRRTIVFR